MQKYALSEFVKQLEVLKNNNFKKDYSWELQAKLPSLTTTSDGADYNRCVDSEDCDKLLPIPVYSNITPTIPVPLLMHLMFILCKFETELGL